MESQAKQPLIGSFAVDTLSSHAGPVIRSHRIDGSAGVVYTGKRGAGMCRLIMWAGHRFVCHVANTWLSFMRAEHIFSALLTTSRTKMCRCTGVVSSARRLASTPRRRSASRTSAPRILYLSRRRHATAQAATRTASTTPSSKYSFEIRPLLEYTSSTAPKPAALAEPMNARSGFTRPCAPARAGERL